MFEINLFLVFLKSWVEKKTVQNFKENGWVGGNLKIIYVFLFVLGGLVKRLVFWCGQEIIVERIMSSLSQQVLWISHLNYCDNSVYGSQGS